jgi:alkanesulfonate monooxygenase SsuD/methylene tetrahydromethanopterin reductase-like flavin-dependent oxidoreductase (luciferase family)
MVHELRRGRFGPLGSPDAAAAHPQLEAARAHPSNRIVGTPARAVAQLDELVAATGANEIMVSTVAYGLDARIRSLELLAAAWS